MNAKRPKKGSEPPEKPPVDYRALLKSYMREIGYRQRDCFLYSMDWSYEEWLELEIIRQELQNEDPT